MKILSMKTTIFLGAMLSLLVCLMFTGCSNSETNSNFQEDSRILHTLKKNILQPLTV